MNKRLWLMTVAVITMIAIGSAPGGNRICIDPGHGGSDPGSTGPMGLIAEETVNLNVSLAFQDTIENVAPFSEWV